MNETFYENNHQADDEDEIDILEYVAVVTKRLKMIFSLSFIIVLVAVLYALLATKFYSASTTFMPAESDKSLSALGSLSGLAGAFGVGVGSGGEDSPEFYSKLLSTREVIQAVFKDSLFYSEELQKKTNLIEIYEIEGDTELEIDESILEFFLEHLNVDIDKQTGIITLAVESTEPQLAADIANQLVVQLNQYNLQTRKSIAKEKRLFTEDRLREAETELTAAEDELKTFMDKNRKYDDSPELTFEFGRLRRKVEIEQEIYLTIRKEYELARIDEIRDMPVLNVLDQAKPSVYKSRPKRRVIVLVAGFLSVFVGIFLAFVLEYFERLKKDEKENKKMQEIADDVKNQLNNILPKKK